MAKIKKETIEALKNLVTHIVQEIVDHPDDVEVNIMPGSYRLLAELHTNPGDVGQVIGQGGHVVVGIRSIVSAFGGKNGLQVTLDYVTDHEKNGRRVHGGR